MGLSPYHSYSPSNSKFITSEIQKGPLNKLIDLKEQNRFERLLILQIIREIPSDTLIFYPLHKCLPLHPILIHEDLGRKQIP